MRGRRKAIEPPEDWIEEDEVVINNRHVTSGSEVSIRGERGRFRFIRKVVRPERDVEWLDFWGGPKGFEQLRSFQADKVKRVHRINTTGKNLLQERKDASEEV